MSPVGLSYVHFKAVLKAYSGHINKLTEDFCYLAQQCCSSFKSKVRDLVYSLMNYRNHLFLKFQFFWIYELSIKIITKYYFAFDLRITNLTFKSFLLLLTGHEKHSFARQNPFVDLMALPFATDQLATSMSLGYRFNFRGIILV